MRAPVPPLPASLRPLLAGILALAAAMGIGRFAYTPLLPAMQAAGGLDATRAGFLAAANYAGYLLGALLAAVAAHLLAPSVAVRTSAIVVVATTALMAAKTDLAFWSVIRFLAGVASAGVFVIASGVVLDDLRRRGLTARSGWLYSGVGLGIAISGIVVRATGGLGWRAEWIVLALIAAISFLPCWHWLPRVPRASAAEGADAPGRARSQRRVMRGNEASQPAVAPGLGLLCAAYFLEGIGYVVSGTFLVVIVDGMPGLAGLGAGVWIVVGLAVIPSSALWTAAAGRVGFPRALTAAYLLQACGIALPLAGGAGAAIAAAVLFGGTFAGISALTLTLAGALAPRRSAGLIGLLTAVFGVGQMIGPVLAGVVAHRAQGFAPALLGAAALVFAGGLLMAAMPTGDALRRRPL